MADILNNQINSKTGNILPPRYSFTVGIGRDGVINQLVDPCVSSPDVFIPIPNSIEAITLMRNKRYNVSVITNQSGVGQGYMSTQTVDDVHKKMLDLLGDAGCTSINGIYYSITGTKEDIFVKPNTGMIKRAEDEQKIEFKGGVFVGDDIADLKLALKIGATPILVLTGKGEETLKKLNMYANRDLKKRTRVFNNLWEFAQAIPEQNS